MKISLNAIKKYVDVPVSDEELVALIGSRLVEIEEVIDLAPKYREAYIVKVELCEPIPDTHLHLCQINAGPQRLDLQGENGLIQVVCGAPNVHAGMLTAWLAPGAIVPATFGEENFELGAKKLRGHMSNGMLAAVDELDLGDDHAGICEIDPKLAKPGDVFAAVFGLNDKILDVENKSLTHRPDCFGLIGFAREVAGILGQKFIEPDVFTGLHNSIIAQNSLKVKHPSESPSLLGAFRGCADFQSDDSRAKVNIEITDSALCPRYSCAIFDLPDNKPSKYLTPEAIFLHKAGMRAIDPMVDLTNILMLETGQPLHAFDYDKLVKVGGAKTPKIIVRAAKDGEELQLLDGKTIKCSSDDILITSNDVPVALAGAMGGKNTEIDASTRRVVLESATFSLYNLRKTQMAHGIFSEAITRFTKGQPAAITMPVLAEAVKRLNVATLAVADDHPNPEKPTEITLTVEEVNNLLGTEYDTDLIIRTLGNVGFRAEVATCEGLRSHGEDERDACVCSPRGCAELTSEHEVREPRNDGRERHVPRGDASASVALAIAAPLWRTDIHIKEDVIEEIGRLLGYDNIPLTLPTKTFSAPEIDPMLRLKSELRPLLSRSLAMHELLTYSFISRDLLDKTGLNPDDAYKIVNSISPELQCFRPAIVPSLLDKVRENLKAGHRDFCLYELNQVSSVQAGLTKEKVPAIETHLGVVDLHEFYTMKAKIVKLFALLKIPVAIAKLSEAKKYPYLEPKRAAEIRVGDQIIGAFGEVKTSVLAKFKLEAPVSAAEVNLDQIVDAPRQVLPNLQFSKFPFVERDLTLQVAGDVEFAKIAASLNEALKNLNLYYTVAPVSLYQPEKTEVKNLSFHLKFSDPDKTLNSADISDIMEKVVAAAAKDGATLI